MTPTSAAPASGYITTGEAGTRIGATSNYVCGLIRAGHLDAIDISKGSRPRFRVTAASVEKFLAARVVPKQAES